MTNARFEQYSMVRVVKLLQSLADYGVWTFNKRPPRIGDIGVIVEFVQAPGLTEMYVVENVEADGSTTWLADFFAEELEPVTNLPGA